MIFDSTREERRQREIGTLELEAKLAELARRHSRDMLERHYFSHNSPEGETPFDRIAAGHRRLIGTGGENIWTGQGYRLTSSSEVTELARVIMEGWMKSTGHRENILRPEFTHLGVGVAVMGEEIMATQKFASVRAYTPRDVPFRIEAGSPLELRPFLSLDAKRIDRYGLSPSGDGGGEVLGPFALEEGLEVERGSYLLQFFIPGDAPGSFLIHPGPSIEVR